MILPPSVPDEVDDGGWRSDAQSGEEYHEEDDPRKKAQHRSPHLFSVPLSSTGPLPPPHDSGGAPGTITHARI